MKEPLKPCPFCGGEPTFKRNEPGSESCKVICAPCLVVGPVRATRQTAIEAWNRRPQSPPVAQVEVYRRALEEIVECEEEWMSKDELIPILIAEKALLNGK